MRRSASTASFTLLVACGLACSSQDRAPVARDHAPVAPVVIADAAPQVEPALPPHRAFATLETAIAAIVPVDTRVLGIGELHSRVDRRGARSSLAAFTGVVPALGRRMSDLVVETYVVDPKCGQAAVVATQKVETAVRRPAATKSEIGTLVDTARRAGIQPHAMTLSCKDYAAIAPATGEADPVAMLDITTKELVRVTTAAFAARGPREPRPWIVVYGGALHNDRFPAEGVAEWSYAAAIDRATRDRYVELDLFVPELAEADPHSQAQPWFPLVAAATTHVLVWERGARSFVVILPRA